ncbi:glycosyltransferase family 2 protein [Rudaeicoccus suwonensis]|uniref:GT2 family glycosyltransferase n=1 Tax=Rudaeicoccus suwonensis TaxID=657409 RepID=A0A561E876_9MICO|nr:glycosyltransferase [Rudaeicoccus suwonensis]TWE11818.1 GT2 family glycosyltransferase [Rudaeicoccus suwonensis]
MTSGATTDLPSVVIAIPTFHRPERLAPLLAEVRRQAEAVRHLVADGTSPQILVVDNDAEGSARDAVTQADVPGVQYVVEPIPGIAAARNRAIDEGCDHRLLAFIDDDEMPCERWLSSLIATWSDTGAAAVSGYVIPDYEQTPDPWIVAGGFFVRAHEPTGTLRTVAPANNLMLDLQQLRAVGLRFEDPFGLAGGEDTLLTRRMSAAGLRIVWCEESVVADLVPAARARRSWVLKRALSHGNTSSLVERELAGNPRKRRAVSARLVAGGSARVGAGSAKALAGTVVRSQQLQARGLRLAFRGAGMTVGALGVVVEEYARGTGRRRRTPAALLSSARSGR